MTQGIKNISKVHITNGRGRRGRILAVAVTVFGVVLFVPRGYGQALQVADDAQALVASSIAAAESAGAEDISIRPFHFAASEEQLVELRRRIAATRWPDKEIVHDQSQGVQLATMQELARYWATDYDWRKAEAKLNAYPQFVTNIDGVDIHFIHVRSKHPIALPIIITHGWPGSILEQTKIIAPLTNPPAYGGSPSDAFDVVIPSLPGYGFSGKPTALGWDPIRIARA